MTTQHLRTTLEALAANTDPMTAEVYGQSSCLRDRRIQRGINQLLGLVREDERPAARPGIPTEVVTLTCQQLIENGYIPTVEQIARVLTGSRSIADGSLRGLTHYRKYRGVLTRKQVIAQLRDFGSALGTARPTSPSNPPSAPAAAPEITEEVDDTTEPADDGWKEVDFFRAAPFDKLEDDKATELYRAVTDLGVRKTTTRLPAYMANARSKYPRAYEPWTRNEKALLIEAMCYTNDAEKLADVFGRSAKSLIRQGQILIWESQKRSRQEK